MTPFSLALLAVLVLLVLVGLLRAWLEARQAVALEAVAEAMGEVVDSQRLELEAEAARVIRSLEPPAPELERETNPDHFQGGSIVRCFRCGQTTFPCSCSPET